MRFASAPPHFSQNEFLLTSHQKNHTLFNAVWNGGWCERGMMLWTVFAWMKMETSSACCFCVYTSKEWSSDPQM